MLFGFFYVLSRGELPGHPGSKAGMIIFSLSNLVLYFSSAMYHALGDGTMKRVFRIFDHSSIYLLIAGSYTPILMYAGTPLTKMFTLLIWLSAFLGIFLTIKFWGRFYPVHVALYAVMGWAIVIIWKDLVPMLPQSLPAFILAGGITYTVGILFYSIRKIPHNHLIWHVFVLAGSSLFFLSYASMLLA